MLHVVLFQPEIPQNTGNIGRTCAFTASRLHLVRPLGFEVSDKHLRRSGMDYWQHLDVHEHTDWATFKTSESRPRRLWLFTTHAEQELWDVSFAPDDGLLFGQETAGAPPWLHREIGSHCAVKIPKAHAAMRSLNLSVAAGVGLFEAIRQVRGVTG